MEINNTKRQAAAQKQYRKTQANKGLIRFELQIKAESKERFEAMVEIAAEEYDTPWDKKRRMAKARAAIFDEITQGVLHEFVALKTAMQELKDEIKVLSPQFFKPTVSDHTPLPEAIAALPDDPAALKIFLAQTYVEAQQAKQRAQRYEQQSNQYEKLYDTVNRYNDELAEKLKPNAVDEE